MAGASHLPQDQRVAAVHGKRRLWPQSGRRSTTCSPKTARKAEASGQVLYFVSMAERWIRTDLIAMIGVIVAIAAAMASFLVPEVRAFLELDRHDLQKQESIHDFVGTWSGTIDYGGRIHTARITLRAGAPGTVIGVSRHPSLRCAGELMLIDVVDGEMRLTESVTEGRSRCVDGSAVITRTSVNTTRWQWRYQDGREAGVGTLLRE